MSGGNGWPLWNNEAGIKKMDTNHIQNTIAWIEKNWEKFDDDNEHLTADHWSLEGQVVFQPGKPWYEERLEALKAELKERNE